MNGIIKSILCILIVYTYIHSETQGVYYPANAWTKSEIRVCWNTSSFKSSYYGKSFSDWKTEIEKHVIASWNGYANIGFKFVTTDCDFSIKESDKAYAGIGMNVKSAGFSLDFDYINQPHLLRDLSVPAIGLACSKKSATEPNETAFARCRTQPVHYETARLRILSQVTHEFGHVLGLIHEAMHPTNIESGYSICNQKLGLDQVEKDALAKNPDYYLKFMSTTYYDLKSSLNGCNLNFGNTSDRPSCGDIATIREMYAWDKVTHAKATDCDWKCGGSLQKITSTLDENPFCSIEKRAELSKDLSQIKNSPYPKASNEYSIKTEFWSNMYSDDPPIKMDETAKADIQRRKSEFDKSNGGNGSDATFTDAEMFTIAVTAGCLVGGTGAGIVTGGMGFVGGCVTGALVVAGAVGVVVAIYWTVEGLVYLVEQGGKLYAFMKSKIGDAFSFLGKATIEGINIIIDFGGNVGKYIIKYSVETGKAVLESVSTAGKYLTIAVKESGELVVDIYTGASSGLKSIGNLAVDVGSTLGNGLFSVFKDDKKRRYVKIKINLSPVFLLLLEK